MADAQSSLSFSTLIHMLTIKLNPKNYMIWKTQVETLLTSEKLFGYIDGSIVPSPSSSTLSDASSTPDSDLSIEAWKALDRRLCSLLMATISEECLTETIGCSSSKEIWDALAAAYQSHSKSRELQLKEELLNLRRDTGSVIDLHRQFKTICDELAAMGCVIPNIDRVHWFLRALGTNFTNFSSVIMANIVQDKSCSKRSI